MNSVIKKIAAARPSFGEVKKDVKGYDYKYADLGGIMAAVMPALDAEGVIIYWDFEIQERYLTCKCIATDGETDLSSSIYLPLSVLDKCRNATQEMGKLYTYGRRYSVAALLNIVADEDTDAAQTPAPAALAAPQPQPRAKVPFRDTPGDWVWLSLQFKKYQTPRDVQDHITNIAIGRLTDELEDMISQRTIGGK